MTKMKICALFFICAILALWGCSGNMDAAKNDEATNADTNSSERIRETITVKRGDITPTMSAQATIVQASPFVLTAPQSGVFEANVFIDDSVPAGDTVGYVNEKALEMPVDGTIISVFSANESVPKNYPVVLAQYTGFSLNVEAADFLHDLPENAALKARFQIPDGVGPTEALAVVVPLAISEDHITIQNASAQIGTLQCLIGQDIDVKSGQTATVVICADVRKDVLILPLSVVAGRRDKGLVTLIQDGNAVQTEVTFGVTDGAYIEILSGVEEGDTVSTIAPNLDPRRNH